MIVIPVDIECLVQCAIIAVIFEVMRMAIAYVLARPSAEVNKLEIEKYDAMAEVAKIKSVQLEFVKHSKLTRNVIKIEKTIETLQAQYFPRLLKVRKIFRILRVRSPNLHFPASFVWRINVLCLSLDCRWCSISLQVYILAANL